MKLQQPQSVASIARILNCRFKGNPEQIITGLNEIHCVEPGDIVFVDNKKYYEKALKSNATVILIDKEVDFPEGKSILISAHPFDDFNKLTKHFKPTLYFDKSRGENVEIDPTALIYPNVIIGNNVKIGANSTIYPGVVILDNTSIEENVLIGANTVIGQHAFYYKKKETSYDRMHSCGGVWIKKDVEIGALCTIDCGVSSNTIIGEGTKIDNQVQIGHDVVIGKNCLFAANTGVAGAVIIKDNVTFWGQVGCTSGVTIGENVTVLAQSGISKSLEANKTYFGSPAQDIRIKYKEMAALRKLPEIIENI